MERIALYQQILVPVDGSDTSDAGLAEATRLAHLTGAKLRLLQVVDDMPMIMSGDTLVAMTTDVFDLLRKNGQRILDEARKQVEAAGIAAETRLYDSFDGRLSDRIVKEVAEWPADLIVLGTHGRRGVGRMLLGSDAEQVLRTATESSNWDLIGLGSWRTLKIVNEGRTAVAAVAARACTSGGLSDW